MTAAVQTLVRINPQVGPAEFMKALIAIRKSRRMTAADVGKRMHLEARSVSALERRALKGVDMRLSTLVAYLDAIGVVMGLRGDLMTAGLATRGTTNRNARGGSDTRRRRREWLVETYRANVDLEYLDPVRRFWPHEVPVGDGVPACRCYRCGTLLTVDTVTVDRIIPGAKGGTYRRSNIRPACQPCNSETGGAVRGNGKRKARAAA